MNLEIQGLAMDFGAQSVGVRSTSWLRLGICEFGGLECKDHTASSLPMNAARARLGKPADACSAGWVFEC